MTCSRSPFNRGREHVYFCVRYSSAFVFELFYEVKVAHSPEELAFVDI